MNYLRIIFFALAVVMAASPSFASTLGVAGNYNVFVFGNYVSSGDIHVTGSVAVGGNLTAATSLGVAQAQSGAGGTDTLVVKGDLSVPNGNVFYGNAKIGGSDNSGTGFGVNSPGTLTENATMPFVFADALSYYTNLTVSLRDAVSSGNTTILSTADVQSNDWLNSALSALTLGKTVVVNVSGINDLNWSGWSLESLNGYRDSILFNFFEAEGLTLSNIGLYGSILAPYAEVTANNGQMNGTLIAESLTGTMEFHHTPFTGELPTPIPGSVFLLGSGLAGLVAWRRRR